MEVIISPTAQADIEAILAWSKETFGPLTMKRYATLIQTAIEDVAEDPERPGSLARVDLAATCRTYHLFHSRKKAGARGNRIRSPRHFLAYRMCAAEVLEVIRVLHDSMDLNEQLPEEYRAPSE